MIGANSYSCNQPRGRGCSENGILVVQNWNSPFRKRTQGRILPPVAFSRRSPKHGKNVVVMLAKPNLPQDKKGDSLPPGRMIVIKKNPTPLKAEGEILQQTCRTKHTLYFARSHESAEIRDIFKCIRDYRRLLIRSSSPRSGPPSHKHSSDR